MNHLKVQRLPNTLAESVAFLSEYVYHEMLAATPAKRLYFHNFDHVEGVRRRAEIIFEVVRPHWQQELNQLHDPLDLERMRWILVLAAIAHDMVQDFLPDAPVGKPRRREMGVSEQLTIDQLLAAIASLNQDLQERNPEHPEAQFRPEECDVLREAIEATVCHYNPDEKVIFQPYLYGQEAKSAIAIILALADIGALGIEGIESFRQEGREIFLEENPDFAPLIFDEQLRKNADPKTLETLRKSLLQRARFQIDFVRGRIVRLNQELQNLPKQAIPELKEKVFQHLTPEVLEVFISTTPMAEDTSLETLLDFFQFTTTIPKML